MWTGDVLLGEKVQLEYGGIWAISTDRRAIVKLSDWGYTLTKLEKKDGQKFMVSDFATSFLKFELFANSFKKVDPDEVVSDEIIEIIKYNFAHADAVYGVLHPGLEIEGVE